MQKNKNISYLIIFFLVLILVSSFTINKIGKKKNQILATEPISVNLLAVVHPDLSWKFQPLKPKILIKPGEVKSVKYTVENLESIETTGISTFAYFPNQFGKYISKINCFCYDAKTLKPKEKSIYTLVLLIDPEVTKDSKTKNTKEVTIQFTFFDYKKYKKQKS